MHTFTVAKASFIADDTEVTDQEITFAIRVRELLRERMSSSFWSYIRVFSMTFTLDSPDEARLVICFELLIPDVDGAVEVQMSVFLIDHPRMPQAVVATALSHTAQLLRMYARETPEKSDKLRTAADCVRK
jgi:hypothetical protein